MTTANKRKAAAEIAILRRGPKHELNAIHFPKPARDPQGNGDEDLAQAGEDAKKEKHHTTENAKPDSPLAIAF